MLHQTFVQSIDQLEAAYGKENRGVGPATVAVLRQMAALFALDQLQRSGVESLLEDGYLNGKQKDT